MEVQSQDTDCKTKSELGTKQQTSSLPTEVIQNSLQMVAEGGGQQFKISVSPLSKTPQGSTMAAVLVLNSAGQHQLVALPTVGGGGGIGDHKVLPKVPVKLTKQQKIQKENMKAEDLAKQRAEKLALLEERRIKKEKEEKEKQERKEKREAERKRRLEEQEIKLEAKKKKEEERMATKRKREEEKMEVKRKKEELKQQAELQEQEKLRKSNLSKQFFMNFFSKKDTSVKECSTRGNTPPNEPLRQSPVDTDAIDRALKQQSCAETYLQSCKIKRCKTSVPSTQPIKNSKDCSDVVIVSGPEVVKSRYKLLQFHTNHRPPYYGTWRKSSSLISPRSPFRMDKGVLDYDVDSDDEWEEEEPGESVSASEDEGESGEEDEEDDGFFVPHGYLSDGEGETSDGEGGKQEEGHDNQKQMAKAKAWEAEYARKCQPLKPIKVGLIWERDVTMETGGLLSQYTAVLLVPHPVSIGTQSKGESSTPSATNTGSRQAVPEEAMSDLIRLVHKSTFGLKKLVKAFRTHWGAKVLASRSPSPGGPSASPQTPKHLSEEEHCEQASGISKRQVEQKILAVATKETGPVQHRNCWLVHSALLKEYNLMEDFTPLKVLGMTKETTEKSVNKSRVVCKGSGGVKTLKQFLTSPTQKKPVASRRLEIVPILSAVSPAKKMKIGIDQNIVKSQPGVIVIGDKASQPAQQSSTAPINIDP